MTVFEGASSVSPAAPSGSCWMGGGGSAPRASEPLAGPGLSSTSREEPTAAPRWSDASRLGREKEAESEDSPRSSQPSSRSWSRSRPAPHRQLFQFTSRSWPLDQTLNTCTLKS